MQCDRLSAVLAFLHSRLENRVEEETGQGVALFCPTSDTEFVTPHQSEQWHAGRSKVFLSKQMYCLPIASFLRELQIASC